MGVSRLCVFLTVLVSVKMIASQPIFGSRMWCDMMCDDDDDDDYSDYDILDFFFDPCGGCTTKKPSKDKIIKSTTPPPGLQEPFNLIIPPANGMNVTMTNTGNSWLMNFMPWAYKPASTTAPPATTEKSATTAAGTTAAAGSTTAAPSTTAKA